MSLPVYIQLKISFVSLFCQNFQDQQIDCFNIKIAPKSVNLLEKSSEFAKSRIRR